MTMTETERVWIDSHHRLSDGRYVEGHYGTGRVYVEGQTNAHGNYIYGHWEDIPVTVDPADVEALLRAENGDQATRIADLERQIAEWYNDVEIVSECLNAEAAERSLCSEYDYAIDRINAKTRHLKLAPREEPEQNYRAMIPVYVNFDATPGDEWEQAGEYRDALIRALRNADYTYDVGDVDDVECTDY